MADKIKKFFQKKKTEAKFRSAGPGYRLNEEQPDRARFNTGTGKKLVPTPSRSEPSSEARQAAAAALSRLGEQRTENPGFNTSLAAIKAQVQRELEAEKKAAALAAQEINPPSSSVTSIKPQEVDSPYLAVTGVFFTCPIISPEVLSKDEWNKKIKDFLYEQLEEERGLTSCLIIHTCNKNKDKVALCVETLCKYLDNILQNPGEEKFQKIRMSNRAFKERVEPIEGSMELLMAAGFQTCQLPIGDGTEDFLVYSPDRVAGPDTLQILCDALQSAEPITLELDRNIQVLFPSQASKRNELPPSFFRLSPEEIKKEQQLRAEVLEKNLMMRTKAMREKDELREMRKYRYALIRIRFPDGVLLQGTFTVYEKLGEVVQFVRDNLLDENLPFILCMPTGHRLAEEDCDKTLVDLRLVPATILNFSWDLETDSPVPTSYLKSEVMMLVQPLTG